MIRNLCYDSLQNLLALYSKIWSEHVFPVAWCTSIIIFFLKPGKKAIDPKNYRPIVLSSCFCKILEKMVNSPIVHLLETNHNLTAFQSGFRKSRSTLDNILDLETQIRTAFVRRHHLVSIFFDLEKIYDRIWR